LIAMPFIFSFMVGPFVDNNKKPTILRWAMFIECVVLGLLAFTPLLEQIGILFMFGVILVAASAALFESPSATALLPQIVADDKLVKANSLIQIAQMLGGIAVAGLLIVTLRDGENANFSFIYGISAVFMLIAFFLSLFLKEPTKQEKTAKTKATNYIQDMKAGAQFLRRNVLFFLLIAFIAMSVAAEIASINRPELFAYYAGAQGYVVFMIMALIGGILASVITGAVGSKIKVGRLLFVLMLIAGVIRFIFVQVLPLSFVAALIVAIFYAAFSSSIDIMFTSLEQKLPPKDMVGRVSTLTTTFAAIFVAVGALLGGVIGNLVSMVDHVFIFQSISYGVIGLFLLLVPSVRKLPKMEA